MVGPTRVDAAESVERISSEMTGVARSDQPTLKEQCLRRDGRKCLLSGYSDVSGNLEDGFCMECAHIVPFGLGKIDNVQALISYY